MVTGCEAVVAVHDLDLSSQPLADFDHSTVGNSMARETVSSETLGEGEGARKKYQNNMLLLLNRFQIADRSVLRSIRRDGRDQ